MKISINDKEKFNNSLKGLHSKNFIIISSNYSVKFLYKLLKNNQRIINNKDENNETLLSYAIKRQNIPVIDLLLTSPLLDYSYQNLQGNSYLHLSVIYELQSTIKTLIEKGIDIDLKNYDGNTALHYAYSINNYNIIILLLQNKIDFTIKNNQGLIAEEIKPNSLKKDELIINKNNQTNKTIIIDWENNHINTESIKDNIYSNENTDKIKNIYRSKNSTPVAFKSIKKISNSIYNKKIKGVYMKGNSQDIQNCSAFIRKSINKKEYYNNTEKTRRNKCFINSSLDSKQETIRKNIFESRILPSSHQINCHICDLNYLNSYQNNKLKKYAFKKISKSQYFIKGRAINNFSLLKVNNRYELNDDESKFDSDLSYLKSARLIFKENLEFFDEVQSIKETNNKIKSNTNINNDYFENINNNESINQKSTNDSYNQTNLPLHHFLSKIKMEKYFNILQNNGFDDINLLISQSKTDNPITDLQLKEIGISNLGDRTRILVRLEENANNFGCSLPNEVYYICDNINNIDINEDFHIYKFLNWLNRLNIGEYLDNFLINGYYCIELLLIQMKSKNPINDDILKNEIEINKIGHRSRILNKLIEDSEEFYKKLKKKGFFFTSGKEIKSCDCSIF